MAPGPQPEEQPGAPTMIPAGAWREFIPPSGGGRLLMPGIPVVQEQPVSMAGHNFTLHSVELAEQGQAFFFGKAELQPPEIDHAGAPRLQGALDSLLALHPGSETVAQEQRPFGDGLVAEQVYVQMPDGKTRLVARFFSVGRRGYYLAVRGPALTPRDADVIKFLDSFEVPSHLPGGEKLPSPATMPGVVAYWPFDEGSGDATADATGRTRPASITGGAWKPGVKGSCLELSGKGVRLVLGWILAVPWVASSSLPPPTGCHFGSHSPANCAWQSWLPFCQDRLPPSALGILSPGLAI